MTKKANVINGLLIVMVIVCLINLYRKYKRDSVSLILIERRIENVLQSLMQTGLDSESSDQGHVLDKIVQEQGNERERVDRRKLSDHETNTFNDIPLVMEARRLDLSRSKLAEIHSDDMVEKWLKEHAFPKYSSSQEKSKRIKTTNEKPLMNTPIITTIQRQKENISGNALIEVNYKGRPRLVYLTEEGDLSAQNELVKCHPMKTVFRGNEKYNVDIAKPNFKERKKKIIWYDAWHNGNGLRNSVEHAAFDTCEDSQNCVIVDPLIVKEYSKTVKPLDADAVIMQGCHLRYMPYIQRRDSNQVFVFAERENWWANESYFKFKRPAFKQSYFTGVFNWTMSYRVDSDIYLPYGQIVRKVPSKINNKKNFKEIFDRKRHNIVWLVSHCHTPSGREQYVQEMMKYTEIHIYGSCGNYSCPLKDHKCLEKITDTYKFVLSFENTYHTNYVTEKLFDWFPKNIIPVVRGGGLNYSYYGVPEGTIVDADSFQSPKKLAQYLNQLGNNKDKYVRILKHKERYRVVSIEEMQRRAYCKLCAMLNDLDTYRQSYTHIGAWFGSSLNSKGYCKRKH